MTPSICLVSFALLHVLAVNIIDIVVERKNKESVAQNS